MAPAEVARMPTFTVHEPPNPPADRIDRAERLVFVKDGFSWLAAVFGPVWLLAHRLWWPLLGYVLLSAAFQLLTYVPVLDPGWIGLAGLALSLLIGFEADTLRRWGLRRRGWTALGTVTGKTAHMDVKANKLWVKGGAKVTQGKTVMNGEQLFVDLKTNKSEMTGGRVKGSFVPGQ